MATTVYEKLSASAITQQENNAKQHFTVVYLESISLLQDINRQISTLTLCHRQSNYIKFEKARKNESRWHSQAPQLSYK